jgi:acetylglutamate kinase
VALALAAEKLILLTDTPGILERAGDESSLISTLDEAKAQALIERGVICGGMIPKVRAGLRALEHGVRKIHIIDGRMPHAMLVEIFTDRGVGTEIIKDTRRSSCGG